MRIINKIGNEELLNREKSLFLCSKHAPYSVYDKVFGWVDSLTADDCVICFNSSELEDEVMRALLVNQVPTILVVMNRFTDKYNIQIEKALTEERMLILVAHSLRLYQQKWQYISHLGWCKKCTLFGTRICHDGCRAA